MDKFTVPVSTSPIKGTHKLETSLNADTLKNSSTKHDDRSERSENSPQNRSDSTTTEEIDASDTKVPPTPDLPQITPDDNEKMDLAAERGGRGEGTLSQGSCASKPPTPPPPPYPPPTTETSESKEPVLKFGDDPEGKKLKGLYDYIKSIGCNMELLRGFKVEFTKSTFSFVSGDGKKHRSRMDVARYLGASSDMLRDAKEGGGARKRLSRKEQDADEEGEYVPKKPRSKKAPRQPKFTVADAEAKIRKTGLEVPPKMDMGAKAEAQLRKVLAINTNQNGGTMKFKEALGDLEEAFPFLQDEIVKAMKVYRANSSGMTKLYFRFLLGTPLESRMGSGRGKNGVGEGGGGAGGGGGGGGTKRPRSNSGTSSVGSGGVGRRVGLKRVSFLDSFGSLTSTRQSFPTTEAGSVAGYTPSMISAMPVAFAYEIEEVKKSGVGEKEEKTHKEFKDKVEDILEKEYGMVYTEEGELVSIRQLREGGMKKRKMGGKGEGEEDKTRRMGLKERRAVEAKRGEAMKEGKERKLTYDQTWEFAAIRSGRKAGGGIMTGGEIDNILLRREAVEGVKGYREVRAQVKSGRGFGKVFDLWVDDEGRRYESKEDLLKAVGGVSEPSPMEGVDIEGAGEDEEKKEEDKVEKGEEEEKKGSNSRSSDGVANGVASS